MSEKTDAAAADVGLTRFILPLSALAIIFIGCQGAWAYMERMGIAKEFSLQEIGSFLIAGQLLSLAGPWCANFISRRLGRLVAILVGLSVSGVASLLASMPLSAISFIAAAVLFQFGTLFVVTSYFGYLSAIDKSGKSASAGPAFLNLGSALGPAVMAGALTVNGYIALGLVVAASYALAVLLLLIRHRLYVKHL